MKYPGYPAGEGPGRKVSRLNDNSVIKIGSFQDHVCQQSNGSLIDNISGLSGGKVNDFRKK